MNGSPTPASCSGRDLPAGSFDTQFTFAQLLTESVASLPGALLVVSIPASDRGDEDASTIEVGGTNGQEALRPLQNVVRRVADQWRPASAQESFEIVRRRLFEEPSGAARADIAAVARRFTQFYAANRAPVPVRLRRAGHTRNGSATATRSIRSCSTGCMTTGRRWSGSSAPAACCG